MSWTTGWNRFPLVLPASFTLAGWVWRVATSALH